MSESMIFFLLRLTVNKGSHIPLATFKNKNYLSKISYFFLRRNPTPPRKIEKKIPQM